MAIKETNFTLDLTREGKYPVVKFRLNDNKVQKITFRLTNNGQEVDLERQMGDQFKPVFECIFRDKTFKRDEDQGNWEIKRDAKGKYPLYTFTYYLTNEVINKSGIACYYFALETPEGLRISTPTLKMVIDCDFKEDGKPSDNYVSEFEKLLKEANRVKQTIEDLDEILKEVIAGGASITEVIEARKDYYGKTWDHLKDRLYDMQGRTKSNDDEIKLARNSITGKVYDNLHDRLSVIEGTGITNKNEISEIKKTISALDSIKMSNNIKWIAHRGYAKQFPENTMTAFRMASNIGADILECDVQVSSDGVYVIIHDETVDRTTDGSGSVKSKTYSELRQLNAAKLFPFFSGSKIPSFEEFLQFSKGNCEYIMPEIKSYRTQEDIKGMVDLIVRYGMQHRCILQSTWIDNIKYVRSLNKDVTLGHLVSDEESFTNALDYIKEDKNCIIFCNMSLLFSNTNLIYKAHKENVVLGGWTSEIVEHSQRFKNIGVHLIATDYFFNGGKTI